MTSPYALQDIRVVIGLGNPGGRFELTRHNAGFLVVDLLAEKYDGRWSKEGKVHECTIQIPLPDGTLHKLILLKPQSYMNTSGRAVKHLKNDGVEAHQMVVIHDELEKKFGAVSKRLGGSARGHNGLKSLIEFFGFDFWRVRIGISRPKGDVRDVSDYVLERFSDEELESMPAALEKGVSAILK